MNYLVNDPHRRAVERVVHSFESQLVEPPRLSDMARVACMSPFHFDRVFRRITGLPPRKFLALMRMRVALERVLASDTSITDICFDLGYESLGTFITHFKKSVGTSPRRLRALSQKPAEADAATSPLPSSLSFTSDSQIWLQGHVRHGGNPVDSVCLGLFTTPSPEGSPLACTIADDAGAYRLMMPARGRFHLFAAKLSATQPGGRFQPSAELVGHAILNIDGKTPFAELTADLDMIPPQPTDPPILSVVPVLAVRLSGRPVVAGAAGA